MEPAVREKAATTIQAAYRGQRARRQHISQISVLEPTSPVSQGSVSEPSNLTLEAVSAARLRGQKLRQGLAKRVRERDFTKAAAAAEAPRKPRAPQMKTKPTSTAVTAALRIQGMYRRKRSAPGPSASLEVLESPESPQEQTQVLRAIVRIQAAYRGRRVRRRKGANKVEGPGIATTSQLRVKVHKLHSQVASALRSDAETQSFLVSGTGDTGADAVRKIQASCRRWLANQQLGVLRQRRTWRAAVMLQAAVRMRQAQQRFRAKKTKLGVLDAAGLRLRAVRIHKLHQTGGSSRSRSPSPREFFEPGVPAAPSQETRPEEENAARKIQAVQRGRMARRELAKQTQKRLDIASISHLRVWVHNLHDRLATESKAGDDGTFFGMFAEATPSLSEENAALRIQACYRGREGRRLASRQRNASAAASAVAATSDIDILGPATLERARRSLVAAGFAVVGEANAEIGRMLQRASLTLEEAAAMGDRVAQRASVALGETLLNMVVDTSSPPASPTAPALRDLRSRRSSSQPEEDEKKSAPLARDHVMLELGRSLGEACSRVEIWLQKRPRHVICNEDIARGLSPLAQRRRELLEAKTKVAADAGPAQPQNSRNTPHPSHPSNLLESLSSLRDINWKTGEEDRKLDAVHLVPSFTPGCQCSQNCGCKAELERFPSVSSEVEFSLWGICPFCQDKLGMARGPLRELDSNPVLIAAGHHFEALSPLHPIPLAYPNPQSLWISPYHHFIAQYFLDPRCQEAVRLAQPSLASLLGLISQISQEPLRRAIRDDWHLGWAVKAMRHSIFLAMDQHPSLAALLVNTGHARIFFIEATGGCFWGAVQQDNNFVGENLVGKILEEKRSLLRGPALT